MPRRPAKKTAAEKAFQVRASNIRRHLNRLQALANEGFKVAPVNIHWGHVGLLADIDAQLKQITDMAFHEGEYAPENARG